MSNEKKDLEVFNTAILQSDQWLMQHGYVSPFAHNSIILNIRVQFPQVENVEYMLDPESKEVDLTLFIGRWRLLFLTLLGRRDRLMNSVMDLLHEYLTEYSIKVKLAVHKKGS